MKRELRIEGTLDCWAGGLCDVGPRIGDVDVIEALERTFGGSSNVTVYLGSEPVGSGDLWASHGFGGTDVTPAEPPSIEVGDAGLLGRLEDFDGQHVLLIVEGND